MTEEITTMIKEILDKAGLEISAEQIEAGLNAPGEEIPDNDPRVEEVIKKIEEERKSKGESSEEGLSFQGLEKFYLLSGKAELEYSGRAHKTYEGEAILLIKPDDSLVVHGMRGVNPVSYVARAAKIWLKGKDGRLTITAVAGNDRLVVKFLRMSAFEDLSEKLPQENVPSPAVRPDAEPLDLSGEEKMLETRLRKLRLELAHRDGITFLPAVYDNKTMRQLIRQKPKTLEELKQVKGFGAKRIERYAASVLETIKGGTGDQANA